MKLLVCTMFVLSLLNSYPLQKIMYEGNKSSNKIVFPKDRKMFKRIIGGEIVQPYAYPFQVLLQIHQVRCHKPLVLMCGATLISPSWVLTAAHCIDNKPEYVVIILGDALFTDYSTKPTTVTLKSTMYILHEKYINDESTTVNDIALVKLPRSVPISKFIDTVVYAKEDDRYENRIGTALGWGRTPNEKKSYILRKVRSPILPSSICQIVYKFMVIGPGHLCVSGEGRVGVCQGDSGGPLLVNEIQVGIASFGHNDCSVGVPSVFTRVSFYKDWIETHAVDGSDSYRYLHRPIVILVLYYLLKDMCI